jgi:hypothetical protein
MTTALEDWGNQQRADGADHADHEAVVDETDITGTTEGDEHLQPEAELDPEHAGEVADDAAADAEALAKKKKQGTQVIMAAAGLCVALVVGAVGMGVMKRNAAQQAQQAEVQQAPEQQQAAQGPDLQVAPVGGAASGAAPAIIVEHADGSPAAAAVGANALATPPTPDFGLQSGVGAPASVGGASVPTPAPMAAAPVIQAPIQPPAASPAPISLSQKAQPAAVPTPAVAPKVDVAAGELDKLRADVAALRADLAEKTSTVDSLRGEVSSLRAQMSSKPAAPKPTPKPAQKTVLAKVAPKPAAESPKPPATPAVVVVTETVQPNNNPPAATAAASTKGKVRSDFRIYAAVDGRFWVVGPDNEPVQVGVRSPLSDGSRVTSVDAEKNVVFTTAGEIR